MKRKALLLALFLVTSARGPDFSVCVDVLRVVFFRVCVASRLSALSQCSLQPKLFSSPPVPPSTLSCLSVLFHSSTIATATMEVASPLPFPHGQAGTKRPYVFDPAAAAEEAMDHEVHDSSSADATFGHQSKRRRREEPSSAASAVSAFPAFATSPALGSGSFATPSKAAAAAVAAAASSAHGEAKIVGCLVIPNGITNIHY